MMDGTSPSLAFCTNRQPRARVWRFCLVRFSFTGECRRLRQIYGLARKIPSEQKQLTGVAGPSTGSPGMVFPSALPIVLFAAAMIFAGLRDLTTMTIPNWLTLGLALAFLLAAFLVGMSLEEIGLHASAGLALLLVGMGLFGMGWIGGGDAKFVAAASLWLGWAQALPYLLVATILGGGLTLLILFYRSMPLPAFVFRVGWLSRLHDRKEGVPYGIALAAAGLLIFPETDVFRMALALG